MSFLDLVQGEKQFQVPLYQRTYSWGDKQLAQLWRDLAEARSKRRAAPRRALTDEVDELAAQADFLREEINTVRRGMRRR